MTPPGRTGLGGGVIMFSTCPFVQFVCYQTCEHDISKTHATIWLQIAKSGARRKGMKH